MGVQRPHYEKLIGAKKLPSSPLRLKRFIQGKSVDIDNQNHLLGNPFNCPGKRKNVSLSYVFVRLTKRSKDIGVNTLRIEPEGISFFLSPVLNHRFEHTWQLPFAAS